MSAVGAVPVTSKMADGNTEDSTAHIATWETCRKIAGCGDFLWVADCKRATRDNMDHIAWQRGRFLAILPRSRREDQAGRTWLVPWAEVARRPDRRKLGELIWSLSLVVAALPFSSRTRTREAYLRECHC